MGKKNNKYGGKKGSKKNNPSGGIKGSKKAAAAKAAPRSSGGGGAPGPSAAMVRAIASPAPAPAAASAAAPAPAPLQIGNAQYQRELDKGVTPYQLNAYLKKNNYLIGEKLQERLNAQPDYSSYKDLKNPDAARMNPAFNWAAAQLGLKGIDDKDDLTQVKNYLRKNEDPYSKQLRLAGERNTELEGTIADIQQQGADALDEMAAQNAANIQSIIAGNQSQLESMNALFEEALLIQAEDFETRYDDLLANYDNVQGELNTISAAYQDQLAIQSNLSRASIPAPAPTAATPTYGDSRRGKGRRSENNDLSSLAILTGLGAASNPMSGIQLA